MASLISPTQLRAHVETGLTDAALQQIIDAEEAEIVGRYGPPDTITEEHIGNGRLLSLMQPAASIEAITEDDAYPLPPEGGVASDYYLRLNPRVLQRFGGEWGARVVVTYTPASPQTAKRTMALINLCKLELAYSGYASQGGADLSESPLKLMEERERILRSLRPAHWVFQ